MMCLVARDARPRSTTELLLRPRYGYRDWGSYRGVIKDYVSVGEWHLHTPEALRPSVGGANKTVEAIAPVKI